MHRRAMLVYGPNGQSMASATVSSISAISIPAGVSALGRT